MHDQPTASLVWRHIFGGVGGTTSGGDGTACYGWVVHPYRLSAQQKRHKFRSRAASSSSRDNKQRFLSKRKRRSDSVAKQ